MNQTMAAARFVGGGRIELEERPVPRPGRGEVLIRVDSCALCGTDRGPLQNGSLVTPGHEISGTIQEVGAGVDPAKVGSGAVVYLVNFCERCACCNTGRTNMCLDKKAMYGFTADGGYAEFVVVEAKCILEVPPDLPLDSATGLLDLFGTAGHAFRRVARAPRRVAVLGCGPIGIGAISVASALGAELVVALDISDYRLDLAIRLGASAIDARAEKSVRRCLELSPDGFDVVIEAAGTIDTQQWAIQLSNAGGTVVFVAHNEDRLPVDTLRELIQYEKTLLGSEYFPIDEFEDNLSLLQSGALSTKELITHRFPLNRIDDAFATFMGGHSGKVLVRP